MSERLLRLVCLEDLEDPGSKGFFVEWRGEELQGLVVQQDAQIFAYVNRCPHTGAPLDWMPDQFLDSESSYIQCAVHGALFEIDSGRCVYGPCVNQYLQRLQVEVADGGVYLKQ